MKIITSHFSLFIAYVIVVKLVNILPFLVRSHNLTRTNCILEGELLFSTMISFYKLQILIYWFLSTKHLTRMTANCFRQSHWKYSCESQTLLFRAFNPHVLIVQRKISSINWRDIFHLKFKTSLIIKLYISMLYHSFLRKLLEIQWTFREPTILPGEKKDVGNMAVIRW